MNPDSGSTVHDLIRARDVDALGLRHQLTSALARGEVERVRSGIYARAVRRDEHPAWAVDAHRYRQKVHAVALAVPGAVFTGFSAIALAGLPIFGRWPDDVYILSDDGHGSRHHGIVRVGMPRRFRLEASIVDGCAVTSIEHSLIQLCRRGTLAAALTAVDAAIRVPRTGGVPPLTSLERIREQHESLLPYRGSRRVGEVLARATVHSDGVLETIDRLAFEQLGFEAPELQLRLYLPELQRDAFIDFYWRSVDAGAEADGRGKYLSGGADAASIAAAVIAEKDRENAIRRQLRAFDRWDWADTLALAPLEQRLVRLGVPRTRPRRQTRLIPDPNASAALILHTPSGIRNRPAIG